MGWVIGSSWRSCGEVKPPNSSGSHVSQIAALPASMELCCAARQSDASTFRESLELARTSRMAKLLQRFGLDLPDPFPRDAEFLADLLQRMLRHAADAEAHAQNALLARRQLGKRLVDRLLHIARLGRRMRIDDVGRLDQVP